MPIKFLGKVLFPRLAPWQRKKQTKTILLVVLVALIFAAVIVAIMLFQNSRR
jgi:flagellar basal body-associated protein FliL